MPLPEYIKELNTLASKYEEEFDASHLQKAIRVAVLDDKPFEVITVEFLVPTGPNKAEQLAAHLRGLKDERTAGLPVIAFIVSSPGKLICGPAAADRFPTDKLEFPGKYEYYESLT